MGYIMYLVIQYIGLWLLIALLQTLVYVIVSKMYEFFNVLNVIIIKPIILRRMPIGLKSWQNFSLPVLNGIGCFLLFVIFATRTKNHILSLER